MIHNAIRILQVISIAGCLSSSIYYLICLWAANALLRTRRASQEARAASRLPPVSILKPLKGIDPEIYAAFRSYCAQDYPEYEIIFGVSDPADPAVARVRQLQSEFPQRAIKLVVCEEKLGPNVKVSNLEQMLNAARYEHLIVNDSDIRVETDYLRRVMTPLDDERVGMVTCLYRGVEVPTLGSRLESLGIATDFCAGVLAAWKLEGGLRFGLGSTLAFRRSDLQRIGGFRAIVDYLADDYELGCRIAGLGKEVRLSDVVVETHVPAYRISGYLEHQMRWARGVRDARFGGYVGLASTFGLAWALALVVATKAALWACSVLAAVALLRIAVALAVGSAVLRDRAVLRNLWLIPARDLIAVGVWVASFFGHTVAWRGDRFYLKNGRLTPLKK
jgi:ceramide glucosyltransferase